MQVIKTIILLLLSVASYGQCITDCAMVNVVNTPLSITANPTVQSNVVDVYILIGDSNAQGVNGPTGWSGQYIAAQTDSYTYCNSIEQLSPAMPSCYGVAHGVGIETSLNPTYAEDNGSCIIAFKRGYGGSTIGGSGSNSWADGRLQDFKYSWGQFYMQALTSCISINLKGIVLVGGFNDANNAAIAPDYEINEQILIDNIRTHVGDQNLKVITLTIPASSTLPFASDINTAKSNNVSNVNNYQLINTDSYALNADGVHFTSSALESLGILISSLL